MRLLRSVSVEPFVFIAILAFYIEFPSIQDLIFTKICLQTVSNSTTPTTQPTNSSLPQASALRTNTRPTTELNVTPRGLTELGRIQQSPEVLIVNAPTVHNPKPAQDSSICSRFDTSGLTEELAKQIAEQESVFWFRYQLIICFLSVLSSPYWGGMSDKIGRLIPMNVPIAMSILSNALSLALGLLISFNKHSLIHVNWLYAGSLLVGLSGGQGTVLMNSFSFISDNTNLENRSKRVFLLESIVFIARSAGFYVTKLIWSTRILSTRYKWISRYTVAFTSCILLNSICILYTIFKLRHSMFHRILNNFQREQLESVSGDIQPAVCTGSTLPANAHRKDPSLAVTRTATEGELSVERARELTSSTPDDLDGPVVHSDKRLTEWRNIITLDYYRDTFETATKSRESRAIILLTLACGFISAMSLVGMTSLLFIYLSFDPFKWDTKEYSQWNTLSSITRGLALLILTGCIKFVKNWNVSDPIVAALGFLSKGTGLLMIATAGSSTLINLSLLALVFSEYTMPPIRSLLSKLVVTDEIGKIYSCMTAAQNICFLFGNIIFYIAFTTTHLQDFYRICFLTISAFQFVAVIIMMYIYSTLRNRVMIV